MRSIFLISFLFCSFTAFSQQVTNQARTDSIPKGTFTGTRCYSFHSTRKCDPLIIVDGERKRRVNKKLKPEDVATIEIVKDKEALERYGKSGKYGVVIITTKKHQRKSTNG